uniref:Uncharacterized protein n=1 Tax=Molossus molossus TaxID=27622 RepID=A0A7J8JWL2_MOLMO|nr:hypothetical protein HJG59_007805 [Molossus molossus]
MPSSLSWKLSGIALLFLRLSRWAKYSFWHWEPLRQGWVGKRVLGKQPGRRRVDSPALCQIEMMFLVQRFGEKVTDSSAERRANFPVPPPRREFGAHHVHSPPRKPLPRTWKTRAPGWACGDLLSLDETGWVSRSAAIRVFFPFF